MVQLLVLADDFTGALDTGVQFSKLGLKTQVTTDFQGDFEIVNQDVDILVIDTESRYLTAESSYQLIYNLSKKAKELKIPYLYKKVDSALRGNVSSEIKAIWDVYSDEGMSFVPSFPKVNRIVQNGILYIEGTPVSESVFGEDPYEPVLESDIRIRLNEEAGLNFTLISDEKELCPGVPYLFDADSDEKLVSIGENLKKADLLSITVGCAGFASVLASVLFDNENVQEVELKGPIVVICGSVNPITQEQVAYAKGLGYSIHTLIGEQLIEFDYWDSSQGQTKLKDYLSELEETDLQIFETFSPVVMKSLRPYLKDEKITLEGLRFKIGHSLGNLAKAVLEQKTELTFLFTGGDTLYQSMKVLGVSSLEPLYEVSPGVVLSQFYWNGKLIKVMTKSGGFGNRELLEELTHYIKSKE